MARCRAAWGAPRPTRAARRARTRRRSPRSRSCRTGRRPWSSDPFRLSSPTRPGHCPLQLRHGQDRAAVLRQAREHVARVLPDRDRDDERHVGIDRAEGLDAARLAVEKPVALGGVDRVPARHAAAERRKGSVTCASSWACAGQQMRLADSRESPLATRQMSRRMTSSPPGTDPSTRYAFRSEGIGVPSARRGRRPGSGARAADEDARRTGSDLVLGPRDHVPAERNCSCCATAACDRRPARPPADRRPGLALPHVKPVAADRPQASTATTCASGRSTSTSTRAPLVPASARSSTPTSSPTTLAAGRT